MDRWKGRVAVVTGASTGCGVKIAETLVKHGMNVMGCARNITSIEALAEKLKAEQGTLKAMKCDVRSEEDIKTLFKTTIDSFGKVDVCINNAGLGHDAPILSGKTEDWRDMIEVNFLGLAVCTREAVQCMRDKNIDDGHIINVNSNLGHRITGSARGNMYAATKFAGTALTEGTRCELRQLKSHINVTQISPGLIETEFMSRIRKISIEEGKKVYDRLPHMNAQDVADAVVCILSTPPRVQIHDIKLANVEEDVLM